MELFFIESLLDKHSPAQDSIDINKEIALVEWNIILD